MITTSSSTGILSLTYRADSVTATPASNNEDEHCAPLITRTLSDPDVTSQCLPQTSRTARALDLNTFDANKAWSWTQVLASQEGFSLGEETSVTFSADGENTVLVVMQDAHRSASTITTIEP